MANEQRLLEYLKRVTADLYQTRRRLRETKEKSHESTAIVSMACATWVGFTPRKNCGN